MESWPHGITNLMNQMRSLKSVETKQFAKLERFLQDWFAFWGKDVQWSPQAGRSGSWPNNQSARNEVTEQIVRSAHPLYHFIKQRFPPPTSSLQAKLELRRILNVFIAIGTAHAREFLRLGCYLNPVVSLVASSLKTRIACSPNEYTQSKSCRIGKTHISQESTLESEKVYRKHSGVDHAIKAFVGKACSLVAVGIGGKREGGSGNATCCEKLRWQGSSERVHVFFRVELRNESRSKSIQNRSECVKTRTNK